LSAEIQHLLRNALCVLHTLKCSVRLVNISLTREASLVRSTREHNKLGARVDWNNNAPLVDRPTVVRTSHSPAIILLMLKLSAAVRSQLITHTPKQVEYPLPQYQQIPNDYVSFTFASQPVKRGLKLIYANTKNKSEM
jgi:hypothetical protein